MNYVTNIHFQYFPSIKYNINSIFVYSNDLNNNPIFELTSDRYSTFPDLNVHVFRAIHLQDSFRIRVAPRSLSDARRTNISIVLDSKDIFLPFVLVIS